MVKSSIFKCVQQNLKYITNFNNAFSTLFIIYFEIVM